MATQLQHVNFQLIRYANCWEDAQILLEGLALKQGDKVLSIASAGDNSFSLLSTGASVVAVDINPIQLYLVALKKEAIARLDREDFLAFTGFTPSNNRISVYQKIRPALSPEAATYWDHHQAVIKKGIIHGGKFERYFHLFSKWLMPLIHSKKTIAQLLAPKSAEAQKKFYHQKWNTWRWRALFKVFFSRFVMGRLGRDPAFLKQVKLSVGEYIFQQAERHLSSVQAQQNYMLDYIFNRQFTQHLPHYVQAGVYEKVKANLTKLQLFEGLAEAAIKDFGPFDAFNLSNIFEYMDEKTFFEVRKGLVQGARSNARLAYWNLMVPRKMSENHAQLVTLGSAFTLKNRDNGFFYHQFYVDQKQAI